MDDLLTVKQAAIILKVHPLTIRRYINEGKVKALKIAGNVRIPRQEIQSLSELYSPQTKTSKSSTFSSSAEPFQPNDSLFRLKGRGISLEK